MTRDTTVTIRDGAIYRILAQTSPDPARDALVLVECVTGVPPRHVAGRRVMMPAEQLRRAA